MLFTESFEDFLSSPRAMNGGGLFNQTGSATGATMGQPQNQTQSTQFGGFGTASGTSTGLFGQPKSTTPTAGGSLFGSALGSTQPAAPTSSSAPTTPATSQFGTNSQPNNAPGTSLFGNSSTTGTGLFGAGASTAQPSTGLFGAAKPATSTGTTGTSLFGNSGTAATGSGLFGGASTAPAAGTSSSLFGKPATAAPATGSLFGNSSANSTGLFGKPAGTPLPAQQSTSLFGKPPAAAGAQATTGVSIFGSSQPAAPQTASGGLFGAQAPATSLFGKQPTTAPQPAAAPAANPLGGTSLFGSAQPSNGIVTGRLFATIDQPSYLLPGPASGGSPRLYRSLTSAAAPPAKDNVRPAAPVKLALASTATTKALPSEISATKKLQEVRQQEARQLINSYDKYVQERPTNLVIRRAKRAALARPQPQLALDAPAGDKTNGSADKPVPGSLETTANDTLANVSLPSADVSLFHKQSQTVTVVRVNKAALEQGYFIRPGLDELASYSKEQLKAVPHLVIGRDNFGQLSYTSPVDLSEIENLGDILGKLVVFDRGTVCVYPDDGFKAKRGTQLNVPCTVTVENAFPLDSEGRAIVSMADPRVAKHVARLRKANETQGAEFITFSHGVWVFKVPHFSVWGLPADEMVVDDEDDEMDMEATEDLGVQVNGVSRAPPPSIPPPPAAVPVPQFLPRTSTPDFAEPAPAVEVSLAPPAERPVVRAAPTPTTWAEVLATSHILEASESALAGASSLKDTMTTTDLNKILFGARDAKVSPYEELRRPQGVFTSRSLLVCGDTPSGVKKATLPTVSSLNTAALLPRVTKTARSASAGGLKRFTTNVTFADLQTLAPHAIWAVCSMVFDGDGSISRRDKLSQWLVEQTGPRVSRDLAAAEDDLSAIWTLLCGYRLEDAALRAIASGNPHLATLIAQLGSPGAQAAAQAQLAEWKSSDSIFYIPPRIRAIYELASGNTGLVPAFAANGQRAAEMDLAEGLDWKGVLGLKLWYGMPDVSIENIISTLPDSDDPEFSFLRLACQPSMLAQIEELVGLPTAFLALQALQHLPQEPAFLDRICVRFAYELLAGSQLSSAIFVAMHIFNDELALYVTKSILMGSPWSLSGSLDTEMDLPKSLVLEARAQYAHYAQNYLLQAQLLLDAGLFEQAHQVLISEVAPQGVISGDLGGAVELLEKIPTTVKGWNLGGKVYLEYAQFCQQPSARLALSLCSALHAVATPKIETRAAVGIMAGSVAVHGRSSLSTMQILKMKLDSSQYRLQAIEQSAVDLVQNVV